jgi:predicted Zn finger-like uncharacterized protein
MIVACESCKTKFRLDPKRLTGSKKVRCSRCGKIFTLNDPDEDTFINVDLSDDIDLEADNAHDSDPVSGSIADSARPEPGPVATSKAKKPFPVKTLLIVLIPLLLLGGGISWFVSSKDSPVAPTSAPSEKTSAKDISLPAVSIQDSTQAYFLQNSQIGQIFIVEGEINNESGKPVSFVLLEGKLYTKNNQVAQSQRCFSGNPISRNELLQLGVTEIQNRMMNREGKDLLNVHIPPSKRIPFMLVFHNLPELDALSDYSIEVISVQAD